MGIFEEGRTDCVKELLKPAERVLKDGLDISREKFEKRAKLWEQIDENYDRYKDGECGEFLKDLDDHFRSKFEGARAILAWSFRKNGEDYPPAKNAYTQEELEALERVLRYNVFEIYTKEDVMKKIMHRDTNVMALLRDYYHGLDRWMDGVLNDPEIALALRHFLKSKWELYKGKVNEAIAEATLRFDWFRDALTHVEEEERAIERTYQRKIERKEEEIEELRRTMEEMLRQFEREREEIVKRVSSAKEEEIERLRREKEELQKRFEEEKQRLIEEISRMKDEEAQRKLQEELKRVEEEMKAQIDEMEESLRRKELELRQKELELKKKEMELKRKEDEVSERIKKVMELAGKVEKGSRFVKRDEARILEMNFVGRMKSKFKGDVKLLGRTFKVDGIEEKPTADKSAYAGKLSERDLKNVPDNRVVEVHLKEKKLIGKKEELKVKALFYGRPDRYAEVGFDTDPLELADINALLVDAREEAKNGRVVLLVASPTGFERRIANYVNSQDFHRNFTSENVSLALLDLESGELIYNPHDEYAKAFEPMLRLERDEELMARVKDFLEDKIKVRGYVRLEDALENFAEDVVKRAFHELVREKGYITKFIEGVGYVLVKEGLL
ncbi:hypothetical protein A3L09_09560 [Thermococcus profundus]|uniref:Uncharacterized protein n=1 Tax=Thermococcus profundus TaxID=49899 RepID=A0A2Z2MD84_THEPR|nr:hypothetical protein [Thermococcus profundus]ASJ03489.1 hypothetical protein A3L09_09560 [Thermococcus profundus]